MPRKTDDKFPKLDLEMAESTPTRRPSRRIFMYDEDGTPINDLAKSFESRIQANESEAESIELKIQKNRNRLEKTEQWIETKGKKMLKEYMDFRAERLEEMENLAPIDVVDTNEVMDLEELKSMDHGNGGNPAAQQGEETEMTGPTQEVADSGSDERPIMFGVCSQCTKRMPSHKLPRHMEFECSNPDLLMVTCEQCQEVVPNHAYQRHIEHDCNPDVICDTCKQSIPSHAYPRHVDHECPAYEDLSIFSKDSVYDSEGNTLNTESHGISPNSAEAELQMDDTSGPSQGGARFNFTPDLRHKLRQIELRNPELNIRERVDRLEGSDRIKAQEALDESYLEQEDPEDGRLGRIAPRLGQLITNNMPSFRNDEKIQQIQSDYIDILKFESALTLSTDEYYIRGLWQRMENLQSSVEDLAEATRWYMGEIKARNKEAKEFDALD